VTTGDDRAVTRGGATGTAAADRAAARDGADDGGGTEITAAATGACQSSGRESRAVLCSTQTTDQTTAAAASTAPTTAQLRCSRGLSAGKIRANPVEVCFPGKDPDPFARNNARIGPVARTKD
jgi:hypothetical protein